MIQNPTLPMQQAAVQQQMQQGQYTTCPMPNLPEFNAIKINIQGAQVGTPSQTVYPMPVPQPEGTAQQIDYRA